MDLQLDGKTALVTGGSAGIGKGIARALAREGVDVAICARRKEPLEQTATEIARETNRRIVPIPADLSKDADAKTLVAQAHKALGRLDILVNNAGSSPGGVLEHLSEADWEQSLQLKFMGYVRCLRYVLPIMVKTGRRPGRQLDRQRRRQGVVLGDRAGRSQCCGTKPHDVARRPIRQAQHQLLRGQSGPVRTERWAGLVAAMSRDMKLPYEEADKLAPASIPLGRIAEVEEVATLVVMLASPLMHMVNGTQIEIDGRGQEKSLMDRLRDRK